MKTISCAATLPQGLARQSWPRKLVAILERWLEAFITWRLERSALAALCAMSDRELKDIGLIRSEVTIAVRGEVACDRTFNRYY